MKKNRSVTPQQPPIDADAIRFLFGTMMTNNWHAGETSCSRASSRVRAWITKNVIQKQPTSRRDALQRALSEALWDREAHLRLCYEKLEAARAAKASPKEITDLARAYERAVELERTIRMGGTQPTAKAAPAAMPDRERGARKQAPREDPDARQAHLAAADEERARLFSSSHAEVTEEEEVFLLTKEGIADAMTFAHTEGKLYDVIRDLRRQIVETHAADTGLQERLLGHIEAEESRLRKSSNASGETTTVAAARFRARHGNVSLH